jgi:hypothetical protein
MVKRAKIRTIDFNSILMLVNFAVAGLIVWSYNVNHDNQYVNFGTILLGLTLCLQTHVALALEKKQRDPFVILLVITMIFYFSLRIATLTLYPYSVVFVRYSYTAENSNVAALFIIIANFFFYFGLFAVRSKKPAAIETDGWKPVSTLRVFAIVILGILFLNAKSSFWNEAAIPRELLFLELFFSASIILLMALTYYLLFRKVLPKKVALGLIVLIAAEAILHTLTGSRAAIVGIVQNVIFVLLAVFGAIKMSRRLFLIFICLAPVAAVLLAASFSLATQMRTHNAAKEGLDLASVLEIAEQIDFRLDNADSVFPPVFDRIGYFDYSAEIIAHADRYASVINVESYVKSIVDNLLTPGFDIFDQARISNSLKFIYADTGPPLKSQVSADYQSDQLGIYGELYALFGYVSLPLFAILAILFKLAYYRLRPTNPFDEAIKKVVILYIFLMCVNSYGFDWTIIESLPFVISVFLYRLFFPVVRDARQDHGDRAAASPAPAAAG